MRKVKVAVTQMACVWDREKNIAAQEELIREAAKSGANVILPQELFETPYFCIQQNFSHMKLATLPEENPALIRMREVARELGVVIPVSFFERAGNTAFNTAAVVDADGSIAGYYRKTHIPDGIPYAEKFYFTPGDTGFRVFPTRFGNLGVAVCWDQWFPEAARSMALLGADMLLYPTAIGSEPFLGKNSHLHWRNAMAGHAAANMMPVAAANRVGTETEGTSVTFYGSSFIADQHGEIAAEADDHSACFVTAEFDLDALADERREWGIFRDRRPEMYGTLMTHGAGR